MFKRRLDREEGFVSKTTKRGKGSSVRILEDPLVRYTSAGRHSISIGHSGVEWAPVEVDVENPKLELELGAWARPSCVIC